MFSWISGFFGGGAASSNAGGLSGSFHKATKQEQWECLFVSFSHSTFFMVVCCSMLFFVCLLWFCLLRKGT